MPPVIRPATVTIVVFVVSFGSFSQPVHTAFGQQPAPASVTADSDEATRRAAIMQSPEMKDAINWVRDYAEVSLIHGEKELAELAEDMKKMSADELEEFLRQVARYREVIDSKQWLEMHTWLKQFLAVQAKYSDQELEKLRKEISDMSPNELRELLMEFQIERAAGTRRHALETQTREKRVASAVQQTKPLPATGNRVPSFGGAAGVRDNRPYQGYYSRRPVGRVLWPFRRR